MPIDSVEQPGDQPENELNGGSAGPTVLGTLLINVPGIVDPGSPSFTLASTSATYNISAANITITPGMPDAQGNPTSDLSASLITSLAPDGFLAGQIATLTENPYTCGGVSYPAVSEPGEITASMVGLPPATALDWDASLDGPYVNITTQSALLDSGGAEYVHLRWTVVDTLLAAPVVLTGNANVLSIEMAIVHTSPLESDWQTATLLTRSAGDAMDGQYSLIKAGAGTAVPLAVGTWRVYGRLTTTGEQIEEHAPGYLIVL